MFFENTACLRCGTELGYDPSYLGLVALDPEVHARCRLADTIGCNWLVPAERAGDRCLSCALTRTRPNDDDAAGLAAWVQVEYAKRRLVNQLLVLGLPLDGLAFDLLSSAGGPITTGHVDGVVTIDLAEADGASREQRRVELREPYRTVLGHLRHEAGHFYWTVLVERGGAIDAFRERFGDERDDYAAALRRHYASGPPDRWQERYVSAYAAAHPWEDWAETFAHLLHILATLETAAAHGVTVAGPRQSTVEDVEALTASPVHDVFDATFEELLADWLPLTYALNAINRAMGKDDLYPFVLAPPVVAKLGWAFTTVKQRRHTGLRASS